jgi:hypothetical protein
MTKPLKKGETQLHRNIVEALVRYFAEQGWEILYAACGDYEDPPAQGRHEPDVIAQDSRGVWVIGEAKTGDGDLNTEHSRQQYWDFAHRVMKNGKRTPCPFYTCVPREHEAALRAIFEELNIASKPNVHILTYA